MIEVNVIEIDGTNYVILEEIVIDNNKYVYLVNENDEADFFVNKIKVENNEEILVNLDNEEEFNKAMLEFVMKNKDILKDDNN